MKRFLLVLSLIILAGLTACGGEEATTGPLKITFIHDYEKGLALAKEKNMPIMLIFEADWCGACKELKKDVFTDKKVGEASQKLVCIAINVDKDNKTASQYKVRYIPSIFFMDPTGTQSMPYNGPRTPEAFINIMNGFGKKFTS